jgi:hypothetical protein
MRSIPLGFLLKAQLAPQDLNGLRLEVPPPFGIANDFHGASVCQSPNGLAAHPKLTGNFPRPQQLFDHLLLIVLNVRILIINME